MVMHMFGKKIDVSAYIYGNLCEFLNYFTNMNYAVTKGRIVGVNMLKSTVANTFLSCDKHNFMNR